MFGRIANYLLDMRARQRINIALSRGGAMMNSRNVDLTKPDTWEFSGFSQNGEDGILDVLRRKLSDSNRYFIEVGASDGLENNTAWLVVAEKYSGLMIEGSARLAERAKRTVVGQSIGAECHSMFVTRESVSKLKELALRHDPDVFSLDIDGNDYYIAEAMFDSGFRPRIVVVEYNSAYGPERSTTIEYKADFVYTEEHPTYLFYGVSISGWRKFFDRLGYRFVTVDRNGVNAFFVDPAFFETSFLDHVNGLEFAENQSQYKRFRGSHEVQFPLIADREFSSI